MSRSSTPESDAERNERLHHSKIAMGGGLAAAIVGFGGMAFVGTATSFEARRLLDAVLPTVRFAASSYVAGGATILALMLTLITFSISNDLEFRQSHYRRIRQISFLTTSLIVGSVLLLMFLSFPLGEADAEPSWYVVVYYAVLFGGAVTGGAFISVVLMLLYAIRGLVLVGQNPEQAELVITEEESD